MRFRVFTFLLVLALVGCESKAHKVAQLQAQYNAAYAAYTKDCPGRQHFGFRADADWREADSHANCRSRSEEESPGSTVQTAVRSPR